MNGVTQLVEWFGLHVPCRGGMLGYFIALWLVGIAFLVRFALFPLEAGLQYLTFFPAVALAVVIGGFGPGVLAILLGMCLATFVFTPPYYTVSLRALQADVWANVVFLVDGLIVCSVVVAMQRQRASLDEVNASLRITREAIETTSDGYWLCDTSGKLLDVNDSYCRMSGYSREALLSMHVSDLEALESAADTAARMSRLIARGWDVFETQHRCRDGKVLDLEVSASYLRHGDGYFPVFVRDISMRKLIEQESRRSRIELRDLYERAPCGYHSLDSEGRILRINQTEADWLGYSRDELIGRRISEFHDQADADAFAAQFSCFKQDGYVNNVQIKMLRKDGSPFFVLLSAVAVYDAAGNYMMNRAALVDVTERVQVEIELRNSEERFRHLFEQAPIGIAMVRHDRKILLANSACCAMFGYTPDALCQLTIADLVCPDSLASGAAAIDSKDELSAGSVDRKFISNGGREFWGRVTSTGMIGQESEAPYSLVIVEDINSRIEQEDRRLAEIREQRDVLVREVHHRIKNNLQGVVGLLRQHALDHPEMTEVIDVTVGRIYSIAIIHGLQAQSASEEVALEQLMKSVIDASDGNIGYQNKLLRPVFILREESVPLALVLNELITNACKHRIPFSMVNVSLDMSGDETVIEISNQFDPARNNESGSGQGLNLVKSLLPKRSADLVLTHNAGVFSVVLTLSSAVTITGLEQT